MRLRMNRFPVWLAHILFLVRPHYLWAVQLDDLDPDKDWRLQRLTIAGNLHFSTRQLRQQLLSQTRPWTTPWRSFPRFDPVTFAADLTRLKRFYEMQGYYETSVSYDLSVDTQKSYVSALLTIHESEPTRVRELSLSLQDQSSLNTTLETVRPSLALQEGAVFAEEKYQQSEATMKTFLLDRHYGRAKVQRSAQVIRDQHAARVQYTI